MLFRFRLEVRSEWKGVSLVVLLADEMLLETPLEVDEIEETVLEFGVSGLELALGLLMLEEWSDEVDKLELNEESSQVGVWLSSSFGDDSDE